MKNTFLNYTADTLKDVYKSIDDLAKEVLNITELKQYPKARMYEEIE